MWNVSWKKKLREDKKKKKVYITQLRLQKQEVEVEEEREALTERGKCKMQLTKLERELRDLF